MRSPDVVPCPDDRNNGTSSRCDGVASRSAVAYRDAVDLRFSPAQEAFRTEVRDWMTTHAPRSAPPAAGRALVDYQREWQAELAGVALVAVHWPRDFGGRSLGWTEAFIVQEEIALARAPEIVNRVAVNLVGPTLLQHGTAEQRERYLHRIVTADDMWWLLFSEPEAVTDLASRRTPVQGDHGGDEDGRQSD